MSNVFWCAAPVVAVRADEWFPRLDQAAQASPLRRARLCAHPGVEDDIHEMLILLRHDAVLLPLGKVGNSKSYHVLEGAMSVVLLDDDGEIVDCLRLTAPQGGGPFFFRLHAPLWHTVLPETERVIYHEVSRGPFDPATFPVPPWTPAGAAEKLTYHRDLVARCRRWSAERTPPPGEP